MRVVRYVATVIRHTYVHTSYLFKTGYLLSYGTRKERLCEVLIIV